MTNVTASMKGKSVTNVTGRLVFNRRSIKKTVRTASKSVTNVTANSKGKSVTNVTVDWFSIGALYKKQFEPPAKV